MPDDASSPPAKKKSRAIEGFALVLALLALVPAGKAVLYDTLDPDSFIHLQAADQMSLEGIGPIVDHQSYMSIKEPWTPYSWLGEFVMKFIWDLGGFRGALLTHALMASGLICLYALAASTRVGMNGSDGGRRLFRILAATAFAAFLTIPYLSFRPVTMALLVMAVCVWLLVRDRTRGERTRAVWLVIPLTVLLVNLHLYAIIVPMWLAALWAGAFWEALRMPRDARAEARRRLARYTLLGIGASLACLATPMLPGVLRSIAFYQTTDVMVAGSQVQEYLPFYTGLSGKISAALVAIMLACSIWRWRELRAGEVFWLIGSVMLLMRMSRFCPVFAMAAAPIFAATMLRFRDGVFATAPLRIVAAALFAAGLFHVVAEFPGRSTSIDFWLDRDRNLLGYPTRAAGFVERHIPPRTGHLINEYTWGGYLSWRLRPKYQVLLDGRTNLYTPAFWQSTYLAGPEECASFLASLDADAAILPNGSTRFPPALEAHGWTRVWTDERAVVMVPPGTKLRTDIHSEGVDAGGE